VPPIYCFRKDADSKMVCNLSIKRVPDNVIIKVYEQTYMTISKVAVKNLDALYTLQQLMKLKSLKEAK